MHISFHLRQRGRESCMTSASELFYNSRSRGGRNPEVGLGLDGPSSSARDPDLRQPRRHGRYRRLHDSDHAVHGRVPLSRHLCHRLPPAEREPVQYDNTGASGSGNSSTSSTASGSRADRLRLTRNDRLPGAVIQARARLFERLRGISLGSRQTTSTPGISWDELAANSDFRHVNSGDWEVEDSNDWFDSFIQVDAEGNSASALQYENKNKPPGLSIETFHSLRHEIFEDVGDSNVIGASIECSICLERFWEGDGLLRLHCGHEFHPACLEPWVRTCGDCPYCRASI